MGNIIQKKENKLKSVPLLQKQYSKNKIILFFCDKSVFRECFIKFTQPINKNKIKMKIGKIIKVNIHTLAFSYLQMA